jgi:hypothetical protein
MDKYDALRVLEAAENADQGRLHDALATVNEAFANTPNVIEAMKALATGMTTDEMAERLQGEGYIVIPPDAVETLMELRSQLISEGVRL